MTEKVEQKQNKPKKYRYLLFSEWLREYWRSLFAVIYGIICIFDFLIMPVAYSIIYKKLDTAKIFQEISQLEPGAQSVALTTIVPYISREWKPITLQESGIFHLSFGAILTGATLMGGLTRNSLAKQGINPYNRYYEVTHRIEEESNNGGNNNSNGDPPYYPRSRNDHG